MEKVVDKIKRGISKDSTKSDEEVITTPGIATLSNYNNLEKDYSFDYSSNSQFPNIPPPTYSESKQSGLAELTARAYNYDSYYSPAFNKPSVSY